MEVFSAHPRPIRYPQPARHGRGGDAQISMPTRSNISRATSQPRKRDPVLAHPITDRGTGGCGRCGTGADGGRGPGRRAACSAMASAPAIAASCYDGAQPLQRKGVDPGLDFLSDIDRVIEPRSPIATTCPSIQRHPYGGELVYTAFSGSHQDGNQEGFRGARYPERRILARALFCRLIGRSGPLLRMR